MRKINIRKIKYIFSDGMKMYDIKSTKIEKGRYVISKDGIVYDLKKKRLVNIELHKGYLRCKLYVAKGKRKNFFIHRLVAMAFIDIDIDNDDMTVDHKNCDKLYNHYTNLEWVSRSENTKRAYNNKLNNQKGTNNNSNVYSEKFIKAICIKYKNGYSTKDILNEMKLTGYERTKMRATLNRILRGEIWVYISSNYGIINT